MKEGIYVDNSGLAQGEVGEIMFLMLCIRVSAQRRRRRFNFSSVITNFEKHHKEFVSVFKRQNKRTLKPPLTTAAFFWVV